ncbi:hypothetical protein [Zavarzinia aquatilis]|uniref:hypothetical protein n=1 Tax=Zavarzinia aquatilis TaxID=2211142 RepID=UPI0014041E09|nr:hypothetical protein [Zavarzinia aquatilis]
MKVDVPSVARKDRRLIFDIRSSHPQHFPANLAKKRRAFNDDFPRDGEFLEDNKPEMLENFL